jgi:hypothetical protein
MADAQAAIGKDPRTTIPLCLPLCLQLSPGLHRLLIAPEGQRQDLAPQCEAFKTLDGNEAVDLLQLAAQCAGEIEISVALAHIGHDLENVGDHGYLSCFSWRRMPHCLT